MYIYYIDQLANRFLDDVFQRRQSSFTGLVVQGRKQTTKHNLVHRVSAVTAGNAYPEVAYNCFVENLYHCDSVRSEIETTMSKLTRNKWENS